MFTREADQMTVELNIRGPKVREWTVRSDLPGAKSGQTENGFMGVRIPLQPVSLSQNPVPPLPGARTTEVRVVSEKWEPNRATVVFEGKAGDQASFGIVRTRYLARLKFESPQNKGIDPSNTEHLAEYVTEIDGGRDLGFPMGLFLHFPPGEDWQTITVTLTW